MLLIDDIFFIGFLILIVGCIVAFILKAKTFQIFFGSLIFIYTIIVLGLTLFPIPYQEVEFLTPVPNNLIPFKSIISILSRGTTQTSLIQIGGNILLSVPYGIILDLTVKKKRYLTIFLLPVLFPFAIELLQLFIGLIIGINYRSFDIDDFILNSMGVYLGIAFSTIFLKNYRNRIYQNFFPKKTLNSVDTRNVIK